MKIKDLIKGEIYASNLNYDSERVMLFVFESIHDIEGRVDIKSGLSDYNGKFEFSNGKYYSVQSNDRNLRNATDNEKKWLRECIKANKYIPLKQIKFDEVINTYNIY